MQSALFSPFSVKSDLQTYFYSRKTCRIFSQRRVAHLFLASFFADQKIDCDGSGKPGLHTLTFFIFAQQHGGRQHPQDVQILTLDDAEADKRQTFRFEGSAEILELEHDQRQETGGTEVEEEVEEDLNRLPRQRQALEVLPEEAASEVEEDASSSPVLPPRNNSNLGGQKLRSVASSSPAASHAIQTSISSRATSSTSVDQASDMMRKISDHKEQQTDITYGHVNKKVQADTMNAEDQNSDIDHDDTDHSSVLSQSIRYSLSMF